MNNNKYRIRPAGKHILTIGSDLIKDKYAALVELIKNAYDADSPMIEIIFSIFMKSGEEYIKIEVVDQGHGMSREDVIEKWMVPSTRDKLKREYSPKGRKMQGQKGIGRYAASILGDDLLLETTDKDKTKTILYLIWADFDNAQYLEDVEVLIESKKTGENSGTRLTITGKKEKYLEDWTEKKIEKLRYELKKLVSPIKSAIIEDQPESITPVLVTAPREDTFQILLRFLDIPGKGVRTEEINPFPLLELYDYRIYGKVSGQGEAKLFYQNKNISEAITEKIEEKFNLSNINEQAFCGDITVDLRVFDRDREAINQLINRGLKDPITKNYVGVSEARHILSAYNGIGVYRNGFRIRPHGDPGYDWLELDKKRVQNPSLKIGSDQVIGYIHIQPEKLSHLEEKSARDGLIENKYFEGLKNIIHKVLQLLEEKRYIYRYKIRQGRSPQKINEKIEKLFEYDDLKSGISNALYKLKVEKIDQIEILKLIDEKAKKQDQIVEGIKEIIAVYQKHATIGKIINVIIHEGRQPLDYMLNQIPHFNKWIKIIQKENDVELFQKVLERFTSLTESIEKFVWLFKKIEPLAVKKRANKKKFKLIHAINQSFNIYEKQLNDYNIMISIDCQETIEISGWEDDFLTIFINLVDNSLYWIHEGQKEQGKISIRVYEEEEDALLIVDYHDNGPGIKQNLIENEVIFNPGFTTKPDGTGLGLAIAGEAIDRNNGKLKAIYSPDGAYFKLEIGRKYE